MGKNKNEVVLSTSNSLEIRLDENCCRWCGSVASLFSFKCIFMLVFGAAVFLSAAFWLLPFIRGGGGDVDPYNGACIAASFRLQKPVSLLNAYIVKLQYDIFDELSVPDILVAVISLKPLAELNSTCVVFGIWPNLHATISSTWVSILRDYFISFVTQQTPLRLTTSLFGSSDSFQLLRFPGGITIFPNQSVFLLQKVQPLFNFSLTSPLHKVHDNFDELKDQMKSGLHLRHYENLYASLTNIEGSTVSSPTIVQTSVVLKVGNRPPSRPRLRQLAHTIKRSYAGNLGLNHTVFGKVKQIQLSSVLNHSLDDSGISMPPSPAPQPQTHAHHHHHHHSHHGHLHHRHHGHHKNDLVPVFAPQHSSNPKINNMVPATSPAEPKSNNIVPATSPAEPKSNNIVPATSPAEPKSNNIVPATSPAEPKSNTIVPATSPAEPKSNTIVPAISPAEPKCNTIVPATSPLEPKSNNIVPATSPAEPKSNTIVPATSPVEPKSNNIVPATSPVDSPCISSSPAPNLYHKHIQNVFLAHARPPSESRTHITSPSDTPSLPPSSISSSVTGHHISHYWIAVALLILLAFLC